MVVFPKSARDIEKLVIFVNDHNSKNTEKISLTARAAGSVTVKVRLYNNQ